MTDTGVGDCAHEHVADDEDRGCLCCVDCGAVVQDFAMRDESLSSRYVPGRMFDRLPLPRDVRSDPGERAKLRNFTFLSRVISKLNLSPEEGRRCKEFVRRQMGSIRRTERGGWRDSRVGDLNATGWLYTYLRTEGLPITLTELSNVSEFGLRNISRITEELRASTRSEYYAHRPTSYLDRVLDLLPTSVRFDERKLGRIHELSSILLRLAELEWLIEGRRPAAWPVICVIMACDLTGLRKRYDMQKILGEMGVSSRIVKKGYWEMKRVLWQLGLTLYGEEGLGSRKTFHYRFGRDIVESAVLCSQVILRDRQAAAEMSVVNVGQQNGHNAGLAADEQREAGGVEDGCAEAGGVAGVAGVVDSGQFPHRGRPLYMLTSAEYEDEMSRSDRMILEGYIPVGAPPSYCAPRRKRRGRSERAQGPQLPPGSVTRSEEIGDGEFSDTEIDSYLAKPSEVKAKAATLFAEAEQDELSSSKGERGLTGWKSVK